MKLDIRAKLVLVSLGLIAVSILVLEVYLRPLLEQEIVESRRADMFARLSLIERDVEARAAAMPQPDWDTLADDLGARAGLRVTFIDLDGVHAGRSRTRHTTVLGYSAEETVAHARVVVPVSGHSIESVNLKDPRLGVYEQCAELLAQHSVTKGRIRLSLGPGERHAGLTVNEYETLLMRHDLSEVLRDPVRFMAEKAGHILGNPRAIPAKTLDYAKYDLVRVFNRLVDALGLRESMVENVLSRAIAMPASRFLRMKRSVSLLVSDRAQPGHGTIVEGTYQSPILVQWNRGSRQKRVLDVTLTRFI
jgi:hypothetical protein